MEGFNNQSSRHYNNEGFLVFDENDPSYYSLNYRIVGTLFQGLILLFGLLGNLLVVVVVFRTRSMHSTTNCKTYAVYWLGFKHPIAIAKRIINVIILLINTCRMVLRIYWYKGYLVSLAAADCVVLIASVPNEILWVYLTDIHCKCESYSGLILTDHITWLVGSGFGVQSAAPSSLLCRILVLLLIKVFLNISWSVPVLPFK